MAILDYDSLLKTRSIGESVIAVGMGVFLVGQL